MPTPKDVYFNATLPPYNADPTGATDASGAIQAAINAAHANGGGIVQLPAGEYRLTTGLNLKEHVHLEGVGTGVFPRFAPVDDQRGGTWFTIYVESIIPVTMRTHARIEGVGFYHDQPAPSASPNVAYTPRPFKQAIQVSGDDCVIRDVFLLNCTDGVFVGTPTVAGNPPTPGLNVGRLLVDRLIGRPLRRGIIVYHSQDTNRYCNIHFWPYWNGGNSNLSDYTLGLGIAMTSHRQDNPHYVNCFAFGYDTAFLFEKNADGVTSNFHMANCEADGCRTGIKLTSDTSPFFSNRGTLVNHSGQVSNFTMAGGGNIGGVVKGFPQSCGIRTGNTNSFYNRLYCSNVRLNLLDINGVRVDGSENFFAFDGLWVDSWNTSGSIWPGVEAAAGSTILVGDTNVFTDGQSAKQGGGAGTVSIAGMPENRGESVMSGGLNLTQGTGVYSAVPGVSFTAATTGKYNVTVTVRGATAASAAGNWVKAQLKRNLAAVPNSAVMVAWSGVAGAISQQTATRTFPLSLTTGDTITIEAARNFTGTSQVAQILSDQEGFTSIAWQKVNG